MQTLQLVSKYAICFGVFFLLTFLSKLNDGSKLFDQKGVVRNSGALAGLQIAGILWLGIIPANIFNQSFLSVVFGNHSPGILKMIVFVLLTINTIVISATQAENEFVRIMSKKISNVFITKGFVCRYFIFRIIFLVAYETWFRGYLLMDCAASFGVAWAIVISVALYTLMHSFSGRKEILGCIPFGIVLCGICIWFGAVWPAIVLHAALAISYEFKLSNKFLNLKNIFA
jgi:membrane protease YdiL (CAAX protease family)